MAKPSPMLHNSAWAFPACVNAWPSSAAASLLNPAPPAPPFALLCLLLRLLPRRLPMVPLSILIADDHAVVRAGAIDGRDAVEKAIKHKPDIAVLDVGMPLLNGVGATRRIRKASPHTQVLILTAHESDELVQQVVGAGARGYILKDDADRVLLDAVDALRRKQPYFSLRVSPAVASGALAANSADPTKSRRSRLTPREREILQLLAEGKSNKEVAALLGISVNTAEAHRANIMVKLDLHSLAEIVLYAIRNRIITT